MKEDLASYPVRFAVDYPDRDLDRVTTAFRIFTVIPIFVVLTAVSGAGGAWLAEGSRVAIAGGGGVVSFATLLMILFRRKYPRWWFDWNLELQRFSNRVFVYMALMDDHYPSTDEEQSVHLDIDYPDVERDLNRWLPLVKWFLAIPHFIVLIFLAIAVFFAVIGAWFAILFTGRYPRGIFSLVEGFMRWGNRINGYMYILATDRYPPFRLAP